MALDVFSMRRRHRDAAAAEIGFWVLVWLVFLV
jgi:hypothetical protein